VTIGQPSSLYVGTGSVSFPVTYFDANFSTSTLTASNIVVNPSAGVTVGKVAITGSGTAYVMTFSNITGNGSFNFSIAAGTASDLAANLASASNQSPTVTVVNGAPTITISGPSVASTRRGPVKFTVTYGGTYLDPSSISLSTANISLNTPDNPNQTATITVTGSGTTRIVTLTNISGGPGHLGIIVLGGTAYDLAGNPAPAATSKSPVNVTGSVKLTVTSSVVVSLQGGLLTYTFTVANRGTQTALDVSLAHFPPSQTNVNLSSNPGWTLLATGGYGYSIGNLAAGASQKFTFQVSVASGVKNGTVLIDVINVLDALGLEASATLTSKVSGGKRS
jgi:uncharacterized repeat protein (TIGR01451 family)